MVRLSPSAIEYRDACFRRIQKKGHGTWEGMHHSLRTVPKNSLPEETLVIYNVLKEHLSWYKYRDKNSRPRRRHNSPKRKLTLRELSGLWSVLMIQIGQMTLV